MNKNKLNWTPYEKRQFDVTIAECIIKYLGNCLDDLKESAKRPGRKTKLAQTSKEKRRTPTNVIMEALTTLGWKLEYNVYSHFLSEKFDQKHKIFEHREWLYDLHWYTEHEKQRELPHIYGYRLKTLPLVVECEWEYINRKERDKYKRGERTGVDLWGAVKYDFQKLLIANADLRLMIFQKRSDSSQNDKLDDYFIEVIENYIHLDKEAKCLFVRFPPKQRNL